MDLCPCGSAADYSSCCGPLISGGRAASTAEQLMRSRYSAYVKKEMAYILTSLHPEHRVDYDETSSRAWADSAQWHGITILNTVKGGPDDTEGEVEFSVSFTEKGMKQTHHERSSFKKEGGIWYFTTGRTLQKPAARALPKTGRNEPCPCGSGNKFKKCCGR